MVRYAPRFKSFAAALVALLATLVLGGVGAGLTNVAGLLSWELFGLATVGGAGLLAWHLAQLTALPPGSAAKAALPAALIPLVTVPHIGAAALLVPAGLALALFRTERFAAVLALAGAAAMLGPLPLSPLVAGVTMLGAAWLSRARCPAANDNPSLERLSRFRPRFWPMPVPARYVRQTPRDSGSEFGE